MFLNQCYSNKLWKHQKKHIYTKNHFDSCFQLKSWFNVDARAPSIPLLNFPFKYSLMGITSLYCFVTAWSPYTLPHGRLSNKKFQNWNGNVNPNLQYFSIWWLEETSHNHNEGSDGVSVEKNAIDKNISVRHVRVLWFSKKKCSGAEVSKYTARDTQEAPRTRRRVEMQELKSLVPKSNKIHFWYFWEKRVSLTKFIHMSMGKQNFY